MTAKIVVSGKITRCSRCSRQALRNTASIKTEATPTNDICASFIQPIGAVGKHTGQPSQYAQALVKVTMRPAAVRARTATNNRITYFENEERRENLILFLHPVFEERMD